MSSAITILTIVITSLLYFTGWMYLYYFLLDFGFSIFEVDIPFHFTLVYSFAVLDGVVDTHTLVALVCFIAILVLLQIFVASQGTDQTPAWSWSSTSASTRIYLISATILAVISLFLFAQNQARQAATEYATSIRNNPEPRIIQLKRELIDQIRNYEGRLSGSNDLATFLVQSPGSGDWDKKAVHVVFSDKTRYFLLLRDSDEYYETTLSLDKEYVSFLGNHYPSPVEGQP